MESNEELRMVVIFITLSTLNFLWKTNNLHSDATYLLNYCNFSVITNITTKLFPTMTVLSSNSLRLMCWSHVHRNIAPKLRTMGTLDKKVEKSIVQDIESVQWTCTNETFQDYIKFP